MHCTQALPEAYRQILHIDLQEDKKLMLRVNGAAVGLMLAVFLLGLALAPEGGRLSDLMRKGVRLGSLFLFLGGTLAYVVLHELTHAAVMKLYGSRHVRFGFTGVYAYAGSEGDYFDRCAHQNIALAPLLFWGLLFALLCALLPPGCFWLVWLWQVMNISGSAGDLYVTLLLRRRPADLLVRDTGVSMTVYSANA